MPDIPPLGHADVSFCVFSPFSDEAECFFIRVPYYTRDTIVEDALYRANQFMEWYTSRYQWDYTPILTGGDLYFQAIY